jgi:hypothetical protein
MYGSAKNGKCGMAPTYIPAVTGRNHPIAAGYGFLVIGTIMAGAITGNPVIGDTDKNDSALSCVKSFDPAAVPGFFIGGRCIREESPNFRV